ncbi:hypothetical protein [Rhodococcus daqingensis]|uniref:Uncharacterized protein n=1 Tax=Rhodococcus daqingensis TaxID=2479363 RepID=A0ABW2RY75_9NOCA
MTSNPQQGHPAFGCHYDTETGNFVMRGGSQLTPAGLYIAPDGSRPYGARRLRLRVKDGSISAAIPPQDGANPQPLPPLVPQGDGWPAAPEGFGWPNLQNPNSIYDQHN